MTEQTARLLRDAENYLSALHGSVARHDNLAANFGCAGCELRDKLAAELRAVSSAGPAPDQRAAVLLWAADIAESLRQFEPAFGARKSAQVSENVGILRVADELRRLAGEAQQDRPPVDRAAIYRELAEEAAEWGGVITAQELQRKARMADQGEPAREAQQDPIQDGTAAALLATPCDACDHTLNWHRNDVGCTVPRCVCGRWQPAVARFGQPETEA